MKIILYGFLLPCLMICTFRVYGGNIRIIPEPVKVEKRTGFFSINTSTVIHIKTEGDGVPWPIGDFVNHFSAVSGIFLQVIPSNRQDVNTISPNIISVELNAHANIPNEGYILDIHENHIKITCKDTAGLFYAMQTIKQLLPAQVFSDKYQPLMQWTVPCVYILDYPEFSYRGMHLDVSRHFFDLSYIKRYVDYLAMFKFNIFHWHLTDSHGWRLEIKKYPKLTTIGAWRADRTGIPFTIAEPTGVDEPKKYGGYYTQEQVKEIIEYARKRNVTIVPEIEMPGHCTAALVSSPEYTCLNSLPLLQPCGAPGDLQHNFCAGYDSTYLFLDDILSEVIELFPGPYIHIGGDEVRKDPWRRCPRCQKMMKNNGYTDEKQLQAYFTARIDSFVSSKGKRLMGWSEIMEAKLFPGAISMAWHGEEEGIAAAQKNFDAVMAPFRYTYFDLYQSDPNLEPAISYYPVTLPTVYSFNPVPSGLTSEQATHILGGEACLWTENIETTMHLEYMLFPRMLAMSEVLWSPPLNKNYPRFIDKVENAFKIFGFAKINYAESMYNVAIIPEFHPDQKLLTVNLSNQINKYQIRYTTDGSTPGLSSPVYETPLKIGESKLIRTATFKGDSLLGKINTDSFAIHLATGVIPKVERQFPWNKNETSTFQRLTDGILGTVEPYDGKWVFFNDSTISLTLDLHRPVKIRSITMRFMEDQVGNIQLPISISFNTSKDGKKFERIYSKEFNRLPLQKLRRVLTFRKDNIGRKSRFIEVRIKNNNLNPDSRERNFIFTDEIIIN